ncbi:hypothetical protein SAMN05216311_101258 [Chitinophaga sp. CF418]|nr:hypothetical protein SAMN05216311_101258 [Chitinophaga sp. CF418]
MIHHKAIHTTGPGQLTNNKIDCIICLKFLHRNVQQQCRYSHFTPGAISYIYNLAHKNKS